MTAPLPTLSHLERIAREATPGPWTRSGVRQKWSPGYGPMRDSHSVGPDDGMGWVSLIPYDERNHAEDFGNANFIAAFNPETVLSLIAHIRTLEEGVKEAVIWHEAQEKALSKQPPGGDRDWRRTEHREQADALRALLPKETENDH